MTDQKILFGFICGILSQDSDIEQIYIDGLNNIVENLTNEDIAEFTAEIGKLSAENGVDFVFIISSKADTLPEGIKRYII